MGQISNNQFLHCERYFINEAPAGLDITKGHERCMTERKLGSQAVDLKVTLNPTEEPYQYFAAVEVKDAKAVKLAKRWDFHRWVQTRSVEKAASCNTFAVLDKLQWPNNCSATRAICFDRRDATSPWRVHFDAWQISLNLGFGLAGKAVEPMMRNMMQSAMGKTDDALKNFLCTRPDEAP